MDLPEGGGWGNYSCPHAGKEAAGRVKNDSVYQVHARPWLSKLQNHSITRHTCQAHAYQTRVHRYTECFVRWFSILMFVYNCCFVVGDVGAV